MSAPLNDLALAAGPAFTLIAAAVCVLVARRRPSFFWVTAAFINAATLRLFPLTMDILRAVQKAEPFSDEGNLAVAMTTNPAGRVVILLAVFALFFVLAVQAGRLYNFERHRAAKVTGIYVLSLAVGIAIVFVDGLFR